MKTWLLLKTLGTVGILMAAAGCNSNTLGGGDCTNPAGCPSQCGDSPCAVTCGDGGCITLRSVSITPAMVTLTAQNGARPTQSFTVTGIESNGTTVSGLAATWSAPLSDIGTIGQNNGVFTASGEVGGTMTVTATVAGSIGVLTATAQITVNVSLTTSPPGTPGDAPSHFTGVPVMDAAKAAGIVYPLAGVVMPQNVYPADIQWTTGAAGDLYRVILAKPHFTLTAYVLHSGPAFTYDFLPDTKPWGGAAQSDPDSDATLTVDRWEKASNTVYSGSPVKMHFASGTLLGSIYYWDIAAGRIRRIDDGTATRVDFMPNPPISPVDQAQCVGCHVVSRDGRYMIGRLGAGENVGGIFDLTTDLTTNPAVPVYPITGSLQRFWFSTWKPDNTRIFAQESTDGVNNTFNLLNAANGAVVPVQGSLPTNGTQPNWSPDGHTIVYASEANSWGGQLTAANLSLLPVTGPDAFGAPRRLHTAASIPGSTVDSYPTWSPDSRWIAFHNGVDARSDDAGLGALYLVSPDGAAAIRLDQATGLGASNPTGATVYFPNFSPFNAGGYFWLTYISERPYGNQQAGTAASPHQQIWVSAIKNAPQSGQDPSAVPYWLPGQSTASKNISAYWAPTACRKDGEACTVGAACCSGVCSMGKCAAPPPSMCRMQNQTCGGAGDCCGGLTCDPSIHVCTSILG